MSGLISFHSVTAQENAEPKDVLPSGVIEETYPTRVSGAADLKLYLRYPEVAKDQIKGVLALCKYGDRAIAMDLTGGSRHFGHLLELADEHKFAVVAFGQNSRGKGLEPNCQF